MIVFFFQLDYCILCCQESITVVSFVVSSSNYLIHPTRWKCFCRVNFHFTDCGGHIVHRCLQYYDWMVGCISQNRIASCGLACKLENQHPWKPFSTGTWRGLCKCRRLREQRGRSIAIARGGDLALQSMQNHNLMKRYSSVIQFSKPNSLMDKCGLESERCCCSSSVLWDIVQGIDWYGVQFSAKPTLVSETQTQIRILFDVWLQMMSLMSHIKWICSSFAHILMSRVVLCFHVGTYMISFTRKHHSLLPISGLYYNHPRDRSISYPSWEVHRVQWGLSSTMHWVMCCSLTSISLSSLLSRLSLCIACFLPLNRSYLNIKPYLCYSQAIIHRSFSLALRCSSQVNLPSRFLSIRWTCRCGRLGSLKSAAALISSEHET